MAYFISPDNKNVPDGIYEFEKEITLDRNSLFNIDIFACERYILYINGNYICEGPCRSSEYVRYYDTVEGIMLEKGKNVIKAIVMHITERTHFSTVYKEAVPMFLFAAKSKESEILSDKTWKCIFQKGHKLLPPSFLGGFHGKFIPPCEAVCFDEKYEEMPVVENGESDFLSNNIWFGIVDKYIMEKRPIPFIIPGKKQNFTVVGEGEDYIELDAGEYVTAKVSISVNKGTDLKITYSECYSFENKKKRRDDVSGELIGMSDYIYSENQDAEYETYWYRAFRFIKLEGKNVKNQIKKITFSRVNYPLKIQSEFNCSDKNYNKMYDISINTMLSCMHEIFVDCPHYEQQQYLMDTAIDANISLYMSNDVRLIKKSIRDMAESQLPSGLLKANYPCDYTQVIPGFSFFWIFLLKDFLEITGDIDFVCGFSGTLMKILEYFNSKTQYDNLIETSQYWDFVDWTPEYEEGEAVKSGVITVYNMYYLYALKCASFIFKTAGNNHLSLMYKERYKVLKKKIKRQCFNKERKLYTDSAGDENYSVHTIIWAVLSELVTNNDAKKMMSHIYDSDLSKPSFSMNFYLFRALEKCGLREEIFSNFDGWKKMIELNCTTWCENPDNPRSECHAWSSAPLYEFCSNILGVKTNIENVITINPCFLQLDYAQGNVPTRFGDVFVSWEKNGDTLHIKINSSGKFKKRLIINNITEAEFYEEFFEITKVIGECN